MAKLSFADRLKKKTNNHRVHSLTKNLPVIQKNKIVFYASNDFSDNCLALYEYIVDEGLDKSYDIVWLVRDVKKAEAANKKRIGGKARFVKVKDDRIGIWLYGAQREAMSANLLFFTHSLNWVKVKRPEQTFVNLWHGCGYKGEKIKRDGTKRRAKYFNICTVTGPKYIDVQAKLFETDRDRIISTGYARTDWFLTKKKAAEEYYANLLREANATKCVIWMPTFRQSTLANLADETECGELGLPLLRTKEELERLNRLCAKLEVLLIIKTHNLQSAYAIEDMSNIICIDNNTLDKHEINLYGFIANTDGLLSDYSSVAIDYMLLDKPIGYILADFDEYEKIRGWDMDNVKEYMPGNHIYTFEELAFYLESIASSEDSFKDWRHKVNREVNIDSNNHCKNIIDYLKL